MAQALTFLGTRVLGYGLGIADIWAKRALWAAGGGGFVAVVVALHAGYVLSTSSASSRPFRTPSHTFDRGVWHRYVLNLFWSRAVVMALARAIHGAVTGKQAPAAPDAEHDAEGAAASRSKAA